MVSIDKNYGKTETKKIKKKHLVREIREIASRRLWRGDNVILVAELMALVSRGELCSLLAITNKTQGAVRTYFRLWLAHQRVSL